ncbi:hypothetical protein BsWGS_07146 [Bradybaena similaris]
MDWRYPNVGCLFHKEYTAPKPNRDNPRYARSIKNPLLYGLVSRDYDADHRPKAWPSGTEYQSAYCSNYRAQQPLQCEDEPSHDFRANMSSSFPGAAETRLQESCHAPVSRGDYKLSKVMPMPLLDKHYRGARYSVDDPIGVVVPEELSLRRETLHGPVRLPWQEQLKNVFLPNYHYQHWASRPMHELHKEMESSELICRLPEPPTKYWDFYNVVRMRRPAKTSVADPEFQQCHVVPIPMDNNVPDLPTASDNPYLGKFNYYQSSGPGFGHRNTTVKLLDQY